MLASPNGSPVLLPAVGGLPPVEEASCGGVLDEPSADEDSLEPAGIDPVLATPRDVTPALDGPSLELVEHAADPPATSVARIAVANRAWGERIHAEDSAASPLDDAWAASGCRDARPAPSFTPSTTDNRAPGTGYPVYAPYGYAPSWQSSDVHASTSWLSSQSDIAGGKR